MGTTVQGECRICGKYETLTYEHVPPQCAFNDQPLRSYKLGEWWNLQSGKRARYEQQQRGAGGHLLCDNCNSRVCGKWYVPELCKWVRAIEKRWDSLPEGDERDVVCTIGFKGVYPARFAKQVIAMLLATTHAGFSDSHPELRRLVLSRKAVGLLEPYRLYLALSNVEPPRETGVYHALDIRGDAFAAVELSFPPFNYLLTIGSGSPVTDLGGISDLLDQGPDVKQDVRLRLRLNWMLLPEDIAAPPV